MIYIRADMNEKIATGHMMRCLSVADAARKIGEEVTFILADTQAQAMIAQRGHRSIVLGSRWDDLEGELEQMIALVRKEGVQSLLVDSYFVTSHYLEELNRHTHVMYLDDTNAFLYPVDAVLCYAGYYGKFHYEERYRDTELVLGTGYAPLREEFSDCGRKKIRPVLKTLLLLSGGSDEFDMIDRMLAGLDKAKYEKIYAVCGVYYQKYQELIQKYKAYPSVVILKDVRDMKKYMDEADAAVSAAGSTLYELAAVGTPTVCYTVADNQVANAVWWSETGILDYAGDVREADVVPGIIKLLDAASDACGARRDKSLRMQRYVDGKGAERIACKLKKFAFPAES